MQEVIGLPVRERPLLRGVLHQIAFYVALAGNAVLLFRARGADAFAGALVYGTCLCVLLGTSALYHRKTWGPAAKERMRRLDHSAIFFLIAGTFTPMCLLLTDGRALALSLVWSVAVLGVLRAVFWRNAPKPLVAALCVAFGLSAIPLLGNVLHATGPVPLALVLTGGVFYIAGAAIYSLRRPDPVPHIFGYHEVFHALVVAASVCHYFAITAVVRALSAV